MSEPDVSVVLPSWNAASTLAAAIESIRTQTLTRWELLLFDDGSTDGSPDIAAAYEASDSRIRVIRSEHAGIVRALRNACAQSRAPYLARMDADDVAYPARLEKQLQMMNESPGVALCGVCVQMTGDKLGMGRKRYERWINGLLTHEAMVRDLFVECPVAHPTFFMRRDAYESIGGYRDCGWAEDYDLGMRFWLAGFRFAKVDEVLLEWHDRPDRLSMTDPRYSPEQFRILKRHYLREGYLARLAGRRFFQWGAGEVGKVWLREWEDGTPEAVVDINPRKIGRRIHGIQVVAPNDLPPPDQVFVIIAVGAPGARDEIRRYLSPKGYVECEDYLFVA